MFLYVFSVIVLVLLVVCIVLSFKFRNPYKWIHVVGFPGSGKTTLSVKLTQQYLKKGWTVYANIKIPGAYLLDPNDLGLFWQAPKSIIILDEIGLVWDNRDFKNFKQHSRDWAKLHRHHAHKVYSFSQAMDYDSKLRTVTDKLYLLVCYFGWFSVAKEIRMKWVPVDPDSNNEGRLAQAMIISPFILAPFGARIYTFIPKWVKYFDSFEKEDLPHKDYELIQYPAGIKKKFIPKQLRNSPLLQLPSSPAPEGAKRRHKSLNKTHSEPSNTDQNPPPGSTAQNREGSAADAPGFEGAATNELSSTFLPSQDFDTLFPSS